MKQQNIKNFLEEAWGNICWEGMETIFYKDGDNWTRQQGSTGTNEDEVIYKLPLDLSYWGDSYFMSVNEDGDLVKDQSMKDGFIEDMESQVRKELDL